MKTNVSFFDSDDYSDGGMIVDWESDGFGYGRLEFSRPSSGKLRIQNEWMSKDFIKEVLNNVVDNAVLLEVKDV
jgi:hypothetical protein